MSQLKTLSALIAERGVEIAELADSSGLERKVVEAIACGRYTTSPRQRQQLAGALGISPDEVQWSHAVEVQHMYGHGPQFGRSP